MAISSANQRYWDTIKNTPSWKPPSLTDTIGVGIITCNREEFLKKCLNSLPRNKFHRIVLINDGDSPDFEDKSDHGPRRQIFSKNQLIGGYHYTGGRKSVGYAKNMAIKALLKPGGSVELAHWPGDKQEVEHFFLIEDDIIIKNPNVFDAYINASKLTGIKHLMYGYHGPANKRNGKPNPRKIVDYGNVQIALNRHCVGAFTYYHRSCFDKVGLMDTNYHNAFEHVDHSFMLAKESLSTPYWWWADLADSYDYLDELACSEDNSTIRGRADWEANIWKAVEYFELKHGYKPAIDKPVPDLSFDDVSSILKTITTNND